MHDKGRLEHFAYLVMMQRSLVPLLLPNGMKIVSFHKELIDLKADFPSRCISLHGEVFIVRRSQIHRTQSLKIGNLLLWIVL